MVVFYMGRTLLAVSAVTVFVCLSYVPAVAQDYFSLYEWFQNIFTKNKSNNVKFRNINDDEIRTTSSFDKTFKIVWNVPSFQCHKYGMNFSEIPEIGILQNYGDDFRGDKIALLYDPGLFPALLETNSDRMLPRNGGVPQEGNLTSHLDIFSNQILSKLIPDENFSGLVIIDFEHWRPMWNENFGSLTSYRKFSRNIEQAKHPLWPAAEIEKEASKRFQKAAWQFMRRTLKLARLLRPNALWGYYGFPLCFNYTPKNRQASCSASVMENNDKMKWLFEESSAIYPSLYYKKYTMTESTRASFMQGRVSEAMRVSSMSKNPSPVYPYTWMKYYDTKDYVDETDLINSLIIPKNDGAAGVIIWGASNDVNTEAKCRSLITYVTNTLAPIAKKVLETPRKEIQNIFGNNIPQLLTPSFGNTNLVNYIKPH